MHIIIGADHAGFFLKEEIKKHLQKQNADVIDVGTWSDTSVDYPDFGSSVAERVSSGEIERGILICGSGVGMSIVANKFPHVRAVLALDADTAMMSRKHNNTNILALAARTTSEETAKEIVAIWLATEFDGGRHAQRLKKIETIEKKFISV